jgi:hypothetical protein
LKGTASRTESSEPGTMIRWHLKQELPGSEQLTGILLRQAISLERR